MSAVVYRAPDRELNLNESDKSQWGNTQTLIAGLCVREANRRRDRVKKTACSPLIKFKKMAMMFFVFLFVWSAEMIEEATIFLLLSFLFYDHCFIDKGDLLWEIQGKWRGYS